jgi:hypothetical protein
MHLKNSIQLNASNSLPMRLPSKVMRLNRLGSFHQTRLSFNRQLINEMYKKKWTFNISEWNFNEEGVGNAVIKAITDINVFSLIVFCHSIKDEERSDRVIAEKWDMTFSLFDGEPTEDEISYMSKNLKIQELGRHLNKQLTLSRANKSVRIFATVLECLSNGKQPDHNLINDIGYLIRTTAVYGNGKFGIGDYSEIQNKSFLKKPFQAEMLTVYLIRYFSIEIINYLAKIKGGSKAVKLNNTISRHIGVGNATGLGMAPFIINHQELLHKWINAREKAIAKVISLKKLKPSEQLKIITLIKQAHEYSLQWKVDDKIQMKRINEIRLNLKKIIKNKDTNLILKDTYPLKKLIKYNEKKISIETQELLNSILIEPFSKIVDDLVDDMNCEETITLPINTSIHNIIKIIKLKYSWALRLDLTKDSENFFFWYTSETKSEPRLGNRFADEGVEKELPFDIPHQIQKCLKILITLPKKMSVSEAIINHPEIRLIIRRILIKENYSYSEIQDNLIGSLTKPKDMLRCKLSFFGASKYDPKSNLWTRITLFQGAPLPHQINKKRSCDWLFPILKLDEK